MSGHKGAISYAIDIVSLSKLFKRQTLQRKGYTTLKSLIFNLFARSSKTNGAVTSAVRDLTCRIPKGASVGIIGRNGSGKSTLLKLITGIYKPTSGHVKVHGRVAALIELGAGFHPDFSGRENLYLAGIMHGLSRKELDALFDEIVSFAGLSEVIDDPVRTYSSGMFMRLGFSVAIFTDPDVLLIDEVLAVGDAAFVRQCKEKIAELRAKGKTLLLVSHDLDAVERWCDEVIWLDKGEVRDRGEPRRVIDAYRQFLEKGEEEQMQIEAQTSHELPKVAADQQRWGSREVEITSISLVNCEGVSHSVFHPDDRMSVVIKYKINEPNAVIPPKDRAVLQDIVFGVAIHRNDGVLVYGTNTDIEKLTLPKLNSSGEVKLHIDRVGLLEGAYVVDVAAHRYDGYSFDYHKGSLHFAVRTHYREVGVFSPVHTWEIASQSDYKRVMHDR